MSNSQKDNLWFLDSLRGLAALVVLVGHARWLLWEGYSEGYKLHPDSYSVIGKISVYFLSLFSFGHQAVMFFFVLSGFVIHLKYSKNIVQKNDPAFHLGTYIKRRIARIYPPLILSLILTFCLDLLGAYLGFTIYASDTNNALISSNIFFDHSISSFLNNLFLNPDSKAFGSNSPIWSLKLEWWFYLLFPLFLLFNKRGVYKGVIFTLSLFFLSFLVDDLFIFTTISRVFFLWFFGTLLADIFTGRIKISQKYLAGLVVFIPTAIGLTKLNQISEFHADLLWVLGFFGFLNLLFFYQNRLLKFKRLFNLKFLGDCSFTIYIIHFPLLVFINGILLKQNNNQYPQNQIYIYLSVVLIIIISYLLHFIVEKPLLQRRQKNQD